MQHRTVLCTGTDKCSGGDLWRKVFVIKSLKMHNRCLETYGCSVCADMSFKNDRHEHYNGPSWIICDFNNNLTKLYAISHFRYKKTQCAMTSHLLHEQPCVMSVAGQFRAASSDWYQIVATLHNTV